MAAVAVAREAETIGRVIKEERTSFLKKRSKRLLLLSGSLLHF
jgi:hypothetical protein